MKIATWNVNSIRARIINVLNWIKIANPDILLLQELKCINENFPYLEFENLGYNVYIIGQKSYNGVAILSKFKINSLIKKLSFYDIEDNDKNEARYIEGKFNINNKNITIASVYVPNGTECNPAKNQKLDQTEKFYYKLRFYERLKERFKIALENNEKLIIGGDFNTCPELIDMYSTKKDGDICCHKNERAKLREILNLGIFDVFRKFHVENNVFSWWRYRAGGWEKNQGLRLDLLLSTPNLIDYITDCNIDSQRTRAENKPSDHSPVVCEVCS